MMMPEGERQEGLLTFERGNENWRKWRRKILRSIPGKHSGLYFLNAHVLGLKDLVPMTEWAHLGMCLFAESMTGIPEIDSARVKLILVPRGVGKSTLITKGRTIHNLLKYADWSAGIANEKARLAEAFMQSIKDEFTQNELLRVLFPEKLPPTGATWRQDRADIRRKKSNPISPSMLATGVEGSVTGVHMNEWICDDLVSQDVAEQAQRGSFEEIEKTNRWLVRLEPMLQRPKADPITVIGTRWWEGDTYDFVKEHWGHKEEPREFLWTLQLSNGKVQQLRLQRVGEVAIFERDIYDSAVGLQTSFFPAKLPDSELALMEQAEPVWFAGQYRLRPGAGAAAMLKLEWLKEYKWGAGDRRDAVIARDANGVPRWVHVRDMAVIVSVDPAFTDKLSSARTAIPVVGCYGEQKFLLECVVLRTEEVDAIANIVCDILERYPNVRSIIVETIVAQVAVADAIRRVARQRNIAHVPLEELKGHTSNQKKEWRIYGLEPYFKRGEFYYDPKSQTEFVNEYLAFPRGKHRDILDALAFQTKQWERAATISRMREDVGGRRSEQDAMRRIRAAVAAGAA